MTGVQTCALPILVPDEQVGGDLAVEAVLYGDVDDGAASVEDRGELGVDLPASVLMKETKSGATSRVR